jgi:hypothetical protein
LKGHDDMKRWLFATLALCFLIIQPRLANAAVTAAISVVGPSSYNGCPVTVKFSGTISGTFGTKVTYSFNRYINGAQHIVNGATLTLPSGPITVNDSIPISSSTSGVTFDQIWVHNISPGQADVYSNEVHFTVNCVLATPTPGPTPPPTPGSLSSTNDPQVCTAHGGFGGGLACTAGFSNGWLALIWSAPNACSNCIGGYNVYRVDGGQHTFVVKQNNGKDVTLALVTKPSDGFSGKCYTVTAYAGHAESSDSGPYCVNGAVDTPVVRNFNLTQNSSRTVYHHYSYSFPGPGCGLSTTGTAPGPGLTVGFVHDYGSSVGVTCYEDTLVYQGAVNFELGSAGILLRNSKASVKSATLAFQRVDGSNASCLAAVHLPTSDWSNAQDLIPNNDYISGIPWSSNSVSVSMPRVKISGSNYSIDVSSAINNFAKGNWPDYGFLLMGGNEDTSGFHDNNQCASGYGNFSLNVQVIIQP